MKGGLSKDANFPKIIFLDLGFGNRKGGGVFGNDFQNIALPLIPSKIYPRKFFKLLL